MAPPPRFDPRTNADFLAEAARYDRLAKAVGSNERLSGEFLALAADARARARLAD